MRDLTRARETAVIDLCAKRQRVSAFLAPGALVFGWQENVDQSAYELPERRIVFEEMMFAIRQAQERIERLEQAICAAVPEWSLAQMVTTFMAFRGIDLVSSAGLLAELGDLSRFPTAPELMGYVGLGCSESSTGDTIKRGPITKAGNRRARRPGWALPNRPRSQPRRQK